MVPAKSTIFSHSKTGHKKVRFSNFSGFRMVGFWIPTVLNTLKAFKKHTLTTQDLGCSFSRS